MQLHRVLAGVATISVIALSVAAFDFPYNPTSPSSSATNIDCPDTKTEDLIVGGTTDPACLSICQLISDEPISIIERVGLWTSSFRPEITKAQGNATNLYVLTADELLYLKNVPQPRLRMREGRKNQLPDELVPIPKVLSDSDIDSLSLTSDELAGLESFKITLSRDEWLTFVYMNAHRVSRGRSRLTLDPLLVRVARDWSERRFSLNSFGHDDPNSDNKHPKDPLGRYKIAFKLIYGRIPNSDDLTCIGENLFMKLSDEKTPPWYDNVTADAVGALMDSRTHRNNILYDRFERTGIGNYQGHKRLPGQESEVQVTQLFLSTKPEKE